MLAWCTNVDVEFSAADAAPASPALCCHLATYRRLWLCQHSRSRDLGGEWHHLCWRRSQRESCFIRIIIICTLSTVQLLAGPPRFISYRISMRHTQEMKSYAIKKWDHILILRSRSGSAWILILYHSLGSTRSVAVQGEVHICLYIIYKNIYS